MNESEPVQEEYLGQANVQSQLDGLKAMNRQ